MLDPALLAPERVRKLLVREYEELIELGAFEDERVELLRGVLVEMSPQGEPHSRITAWLAHKLSSMLPIETYDVRSHSPFKASEDSMPEPDISVSMRTLAGGHPTSSLLLIEVSGSSLTKDRVIKTDIYAEAGVPEYWIVDLHTSTVEVSSEPRASGYTRVTRLDKSSVLQPRQLTAIAIAVAGIPW